MTHPTPQCLDLLLPLQRLLADIVIHQIVKRTSLLNLQNAMDF